MPTPWIHSPLDEIPVTRILQRTYIVVSITLENPLPHAHTRIAEAVDLYVGAHANQTASLQRYTVHHLIQAAVLHHLQEPSALSP